MHKRVVTVFSLAFTITSFPLTLQAEKPYELAWIRQYGTDEYEQSASVAVDDLGNIFFSGATYGSFGGPHAGDSDAFLSKLGPDGDLLWIRQTGTPSFDIGNGVATDGAGNVFLSGPAGGQFPGNRRYRYLGQGDVFLAKYDPDGNQDWVNQQGTTSWENAGRVATDSQGNALIVGATDGNLGGFGAGGSDAFLSKHSDDGTRVWIRQLGSITTDLSYSVATGPSDDVFIAGTTYGDLDGLVHQGNGDVFVSRFDSEGILLWTRGLATSLSERAGGVAVDHSGNVLITGTTTITSTSDVFVAKYNVEGDQLWSRTLGSEENDWPDGIAVDSFGNVFIAGATLGDLASTGAGQNDAFLTKYDPEGNQLWTIQSGTPEIEWFRDVAVDRQGNVVVSGFTLGDFGGPNAGDFDVFVAKFLADLPVLVGDYNNDGVVDAADYTLWRNLLGQTGTGLAADGDNSGTIDQGDYDVWKMNFGNTAGGGTLSNIAVPEPASMLLLILGVLFACPRDGRRGDDR